MVEPTEGVKISLGYKRVKCIKRSQVLNKLEIRRAIGSNGTSGHVLKEYKQQLSEPINDLVNRSLTTGTATRE